jgi:replication-associated recombination protein RarA
VPADHTDDPWTKVTTVGGLAADEVISCLQKSIRRSLVDNAALCAYELYATSAELEEVLWDRLTVISVEDVGLGRPDAVVIVGALERGRRRFARPAHDRFLFAAHAVRVLAGASKDRSTDELVNWLQRHVATGGRPEIFDAVLDMHTRRGQEQGRGIEHFLREGARVEPEWAERDRTWQQRLWDDLGLGS